MAKSSILMLLLLVGVAWAGYDTAMYGEGSFEHHMRKHLSHLNEPRFPTQQYKHSWLAAREYVWEQFYLAGLEPQLECWNTTVPGGAGYDSYEEVQGCNVVGRIRGEQDSHRLIIGASYDSGRTPYNNRPLRENGAGIATVIELANTYDITMRYKNYKPKYTTVFVAFDLEYSEKIYSSNHNTRRGSDFFVERHIAGKSAVRGVFIVDSISAFNSNDNTQSLPDDFGFVFPEGSKEIRNTHKRRGDFLAAISMTKGEKLVDLFQSFFEKESSNDNRSFRMQKLVTGSFGEGRTSRLLSTFSAQPFWDHSAPAVLLTDTTEGLRMLPSYDLCDEACLVENFLAPQRRNFLYTTYRSLFETVMTKQTVKTEVSGVDSVSKISFISVIACVAVSQLFSLRH